MRLIPKRRRLVLEALEDIQEKLVTTQEQIDGFATRIEQGVENIKTEVSALKKAIEEGKTGSELDTTNLEKAVADLEGVEAPSAPATPVSGAAPTNADGTAQEHTTDPAA